MKQVDAVIVGGGLAGLTAATVLAKGGMSVTLYEKSNRLGGRATTKEINGFHFNLGPHSLYLDEDVKSILRELGISYSGDSPNRAAQEIEYEGTIESFPNTAPSILQSTILDEQSKQELLQLLPRLRQMDFESWRGKSVGEWLETLVQPFTKLFMEAVMRLGAYTSETAIVDAGFFLKLLGTLPEVWYLDRGWGTLVDGLEQVARDAGVIVVQGANVSTVQPAELGHRIILGDGTTREASYVVLATDPNTASKIILKSYGDKSGWSVPTIPIYAAVFDIALRRLPDPKRVFVLGLDRPYYYSVHSDAANLAPKGGAVVHVMKYLKTDEPYNAKATRLELEEWMDRLQPGWRDEVVEQQFFPHIMVSADLVQAKRKGLVGRPGPVIPGIKNLYIAGDWVGPVGQLANSSLMSAYSAATKILECSRHGEPLP